jgi:hypothetical protein
LYTTTAAAQRPGARPPQGLTIWSRVADENNAKVSLAEWPVDESSNALFEYKRAELLRDPDRPTAAAMAKSPWIW